MKKPLSIGIVGAGTAGISAALAFTRRGHRVTIFEKHPALLPLGAGLLIQPQGVAALAALGVDRAFRTNSVPVTKLRGICHRGWTLVDVPYDAAPARAISRSALSQLLLEAVSATDVALLYGNAVTSITRVGAQAVLQGPEVNAEFDLVVIADGAGSTLPAQAGLAATSRVYRWGALWGMFDVENWDWAHSLEQRFDTTRKMFGLMPTARVDDKLRLSLFWSLPCDQFEAWKAQPIEVWKAELLKLWPESAPVVDQIVRHDQLAFATYRHARVKSLANGPVCVIGDAAHSMSPQLGLGTTLAVQDALHLADCVDEYGAIAGGQEFTKKRRLTVQAYQALSCALTPCFQADSGGLWRDVAFAVGLKVPGMSRLMYRSIAG